MMHELYHGNTHGSGRQTGSPRDHRIISNTLEILHGIWKFTHDQFSHMNQVDVIVSDRLSPHAIISLIVGIPDLYDSINTHESTTLAI